MAQKPVKTHAEKTPIAETTEVMFPGGIEGVLWILRADADQPEAIEVTMPARPTPQDLRRVMRPWIKGDFVHRRGMFDGKPADVFSAQDGADLEVNKEATRMRGDDEARDRLPPSAEPVRGDVIFSLRRVWFGD